MRLSVAYRTPIETAPNQTAYLRQIELTSVMASAQTNGKPEVDGAPKVVPDWLKADLFETILKDTVPNYKRTINFKAHTALSPGENYATTILRVEIEVELVDGKTKSVSFMLKIATTGLKELMKKMRIFVKEYGMYTEVVPELEQLYRDVGIEVKFGPTCYTLKSPEGEDNILLEDLRPRGFKNANRLEGLDMEHTKRVLRKMAQWHAASAVRVETRGKYSDLYAAGNFQGDQIELMKGISKNVGGTIRRCIKTYKGNETYLEDLLKLQPRVIDELAKIWKVEPGEFAVLHHGDLWTNNIMFQYDAFGKIKETYFVDYQVPKYASPTLELYYFLLSSTHLELKLQQFEYFIKYYHDCLVEFLTLLKYPKPVLTLKDLHRAMYKHGVWGYSVVTGVLAAILMDPNDKANLDNLFGDSETAEQMRMLIYSSPRYRQHIEVILPWLHNRGAFEC